MNIKHPSGIYKGQFKKEINYFFSGWELDPPVFPNIKKSNKEEWDLINLVDQTKAETYVNRILNMIGRMRTLKKRWIDEMDMLDDRTSISKAIKLLSEQRTLRIQGTLSSSILSSNINTTLFPTTMYWENPEASYLFQPKNDESITNCLSRRIVILKAVYNDDDLAILIDGINYITEIRNT